MGGTKYLKLVLKMFSNVTPHALYAYNWGPGNMRSYLKGRKKSIPEETSDYVPKIAQNYFKYGGKGSHFSDPNTILGDTRLANSLRAKAGRKSHNVSNNVKILHQMS